MFLWAFFNLHRMFSLYQCKLIYNHSWCGYALTCINAILITNTASAFAFVFSSFFFFQGSKIRDMQSISYRQKTVYLHNPCEGKNLTLNRAALTHAGHCRNRNRQCVMDCEQISSWILLVSPWMSCLSGCGSLCVHTSVSMSIDLPVLWRMWTRSRMASIRQTSYIEPSRNQDFQ